MTMVIETAMFLAENELAFRGIGMVKIKTRIACSTTFSPTIQNETISSTTTCVRREIVNDINGAPFFTVMADRTRDKNGEERLSIFARYVGGNIIKESKILSTIDEVAPDKKKFMSNF